MKLKNRAGIVFDEWARGSQAAGMEKGHWPVVSQAFDLIPPMSGNYLEVGVGNGYSLHHMATNQFRNGNCYGIDISSGMAEITGNRLRDLPNVNVEQADFMKWQPPEGVEFSMIFSMEVFYYFESIQKGMEKACSLLKPGGQLWIMVDYFTENESTHSWPEELGTEMQLWSKNEYLLGMELAGFTNVKQRTFSHMNRIPASTEVTLCTSGVKA